MYCQVFGIDYFFSKLVIYFVLELVSVIVIFYIGVFYIIETDEKKINRLRQVIINGEICFLVGVVLDCDCKNDVNCNCYSGDDVYVIDVILNFLLFLVVVLDGIIYIVDFGNIRIRVVSKNKFVFNVFNQYEVVFFGEQELYVFNVDGIYQYIVSLVIGEYLYNFIYSVDNDVIELIDNNGNFLKIRRDSSGMFRYLFMFDNQIIIFIVGINGGFKVVFVQNLEFGFMIYDGNIGFLVIKSDETGWIIFYE